MLSVANVTRDGVRQMPQLAAQRVFSTGVKGIPFAETGLALQTIKSGEIRNSAVLKIR